MPTDVALMQAIVDGLGGVLFKFPFRVPAYYALILRSLTVLEGLALQADQELQAAGQGVPLHGQAPAHRPRARAEVSRALICRTAVPAVWSHVSSWPPG